MPSLEDVLAPSATLRLLFGQVESVVSGYVNITYGNDIIRNANTLDGTTYAANEYVAFLLSDESGALILGKQALGTPPALPTAPFAPLTVNAASYATYDSATGAWTASTLVQSPHQWACWFYAAGAFSSLATAMLASFEVEITRTSGGPPEFVTHRNTTGSGALDLAGDSYAREQPPVGVATWITLPIDWGQQLISGTISGVAIGGGMNTGTYSGTGRLRLTTL